MKVPPPQIISEIRKGREFGRGFLQPAESNRDWSSPSAIGPENTVAWCFGESTVASAHPKDISQVQKTSHKLRIVNSCSAKIIYVNCIWLVVEPPLWKMMEFVSWDDDIPNWMESHNPNVTNQL